MQLEERKLREREFHDLIRFVHNDPHLADTRWTPDLEETIKTNPLWANMKYYAVERKSRKMVLNWFLDNCKDKMVLDYCCGNGEDGVLIAKNGAHHVHGIDISEVSIENCQALASNNGVEEKTSYEIRDAENTAFEDGTFDVITEYGALHHLDLPKAAAEMARILKKDGKAICNEALAHNPIIHTYRKLTPHLRTEWEVDHILRRKDFRVFNDYFNKVEMHFFHLMTLFAVPLRRTGMFYPALGCLELADDVLLKLPGLKWQAWQTVFVLSEPKKP